MVINKLKLLFGSTAAAMVLAFGSLGIAAATQVELVCPEGSHPQGQNCKVTICHRHDSVTNPYNKEDVDVDSVGGGKDEGQGDHTTHTGPVATSESQAQGLKDSDEKWGDIIPPFGDFEGYNWDAQGQAVYNNDCNYPTGGQGGGGGGETTTTTTTTPVVTGGRGAAVAVAPQGAVSAGVGGAQSLSTAGLIGLSASVASLAGGLFLSNRRHLL